MSKSEIALVIVLMLIAQNFTATSGLFSFPPEYELNSNEESTGFGRKNTSL